jgi:Mn-dependent DtxR family transcriptional regulator
MLLESLRKNGRGKGDIASMDEIEAKKEQILKHLGEKTNWDTQKYENIHLIGAELEWASAETDSLARELDSEGLLNLQQGGLASLTPAGRTRARRA